MDSRAADGLPDNPIARRSSVEECGGCTERGLPARVQGPPAPKVEMSTPKTGSLQRARPAYAAAVLALASAAVSLYWTLGGTRLLDTVGGSLEDLARERSGGALARGILVVLLKVVVGSLALALVRPWGARMGRRLLVFLGAAESTSLVAAEQRGSHGEPARCTCREPVGLSPAAYRSSPSQRPTSQPKTLREITAATTV